MNIEQLKQSKMLAKLPQLVREAESLRRNPEEPADVSLADMLEDNGGMTVTELYQDLGIDPSYDTISNLFTLPESSIRWLVPEIIRDALRLGLRRAPIWPSLIAAEQTIKGLTATVPWWNMSDATPRYVGEGETITKGSVSIGSKTLTLRKMGRGISITDEVRNYCSINIVSLFLQDFGVKLGYGLDKLAINCLINGEASDGSESAPAVGIAVANTLTYKDILKVWVRMSRLGRKPNMMIAGETVAVDTLSMIEFTNANRLTGTPAVNINLKTPIPASTDYYVHGAVDANTQIVVDTSACMLKYNAQPLLVETERIVSNQTEATYASLTTGFAIMMRDARVIIESAETIGAVGAAHGWPTFMDPTNAANGAQELVSIL